MTFGNLVTVKHIRLPVCEMQSLKEKAHSAAQNISVHISHYQTAK
jgi:hypothetical protein